MSAYRSDRVDGWGSLPSGRALGIASGVAVESHDLLYVVDREPSPAIVVFDRDGNLVRTWGEQVFSLPHDVWVDASDRVLITDCGDHTVRICSLTGDVLSTLGTTGVPGAPGLPFNRPTSAAVAANGDVGGRRLRSGVPAPVFGAR